jgi:hypothetical protein
MTFPFPFAPPALGMWRTLFNAVESSSTSAGFNNYIVRICCLPALFAAGVTGKVMRVSFQAPPTTQSLFTNCFVGNAAGAVFSPDFIGDQARATFSGANNAVIPAGATLITDPFPYNFDPTKALIVAFDTPASGTSAMKYTDGTATNFSAFWLDSGSPDAANTAMNPARNESDLRTYALTRVELFG